MPTITMTVNGDLRTLDVAGHRPLLDVLREDLGLTGTKECCAVGECGACTVVVDGMSVNSCLMLAAEADGAAVTTVEGLARLGQPYCPSCGLAIGTQTATLSGKVDLGSVTRNFTVLDAGNTPGLNVSAAISSANARPMPPAAPVITATAPLMFMLCEPLRSAPKDCCSFCSVLGVSIVVFMALQRILTSCLRKRPQIFCICKIDFGTVDALCFRERFIRRLASAIYSCGKTPD